MYEVLNHDFVAKRQDKLDQTSKNICGREGKICPERAREVTVAILPTITERLPDVEALHVQFSEKDTLTAIQQKLAGVRDYLKGQDVLRTNIRKVYTIIVTQMGIENEYSCLVSRMYGAWLRETLGDYQKITRKHFPHMDMSGECPPDLAVGCFDLSAEAELLEPLIGEEDIDRLRAKWNESSKQAHPLDGDDAMLNPQFWEEWRGQIQQAKILRKEVFDHLNGVCNELSRYISERLVDLPHVKLVEDFLESLQKYMLMQVARSIASVRSFLQKEMTKQDDYFQRILREADIGLCQMVDKQHAQMSLCRPIAENLKRQNDHEIAVARCQDWAYGAAECCTWSIEAPVHVVSFLCFCYAICCCCGEADCIPKDKKNHLSPGVLGRDRFSSARRPWGDCCYGPLMTTRGVGWLLRHLCCCDPCAEKERTDAKLSKLYGEEHELWRYQTGLEGPSL